MSRRRQRGFTGFVCFLLALLLVMLTLSAQIRLRAVERELQALQSEKEELEQEGSLVRARLAMERDLCEIERRATEELGLRRCRDDQIIELVIEEDADEYK